MNPNHQTLEAMVSDYLTHGGRIHHLPDAIAATPGDVVRYLKKHKITIETASSNGSEKYMRDGTTITLQALVQLANTYRLEQGLAPFDVDQPA